MSSVPQAKYKQSTLLSHYELSTKQNAWLNYFVPAVVSVLLYILLFTSDVSVVFRHHRDGNPIWASLQVFFMFLPALVSYVMIISSWELWPHRESCKLDNVVWFVCKTIEHLCFPIWAMWRFAERFFWAIEAVRSPDEDSFEEAVSVIEAPRTIELYFFLQAFLQSLPLMLLNINILLRSEKIQIHKETGNVQMVNFVLNLSKLAATVAFYQRFKTQKIAGKNYPWFKSYKAIPPTIPPAPEASFAPIEEPELEPLSSEPGPSDSRRSSDFYIEPSNPTPPTHLKDLQEVAGCLRETSIVDGPKRKVYKEVDELDFNIKRLIYIKGLPEDDIAGKVVAFCWWFCFLLARILAISTFAFFYHEQAFWLILSHFTLVIAFLLYDAKTDDLKRLKGLFFLFLGVIYIFCIIEFKIKFKKTKFIYGGFFALVFLENFVMCLIWWFNNVDDLKNDFWFRYIFLIVSLCSLISFSAMLLYFNVNKPKKVIVGTSVLS